MSRAIEVERRPSLGIVTPLVVRCKNPECNWVATFDGVIKGKMILLGEERIDAVARRHNKYKSGHDFFTYGRVKNDKVMRLGELTF